MHDNLTDIPKIDIFVMMMSDDRLGNASLKENMEIYQQLCGGRIFWNNVILVIPRQDFNPTVYDDIEEWEDALKLKEAEAIKVVQNTFDQAPLGCIAIS